MVKHELKQTTFKNLLIKQLLVTITVSLALTVIITSLPAYLLLNSAIKQDIQKVEQVSHDSIITYLSQGWTPFNIRQVYQDVEKQLPTAKLFLQKAPAYLDEGDDRLRPASDTDKTLLRLIKEVEQDERIVIETDLFNNSINAAVPIKFKAECLSCHAQELRSGQIYEGALAGTLVMQAPMSLDHISTSSALGFFVSFLVVFIVTASIITNRLVQSNLLNPLANLSDRIRQLRISSHDQHIEWQRTPHRLVEIDQIDEDLNEHIQNIRRVYNKLDALMVTEHQTGLFHKDRFNEALRFEMFRSHRYKHPLTLLVVKLVKVKVLNATAKNLEVEEPGSKFLTFGHILNNDTRETDMSFRLEENIFAVIAPDTDEKGAEHLTDDLYQRFISSELSQESARSTSVPHYEFTIKAGHATYIGDETRPKAFLKSAIQSMQAGEQKTGYYPPED